MKPAPTAPTAPTAYRIRVLLARESPVGVILLFCCASAAHLQILWDTGTDTFNVGQWVWGRIFPEKCDISPDGRLVAYFAAGSRDVHRRGVPNAWTGISRPPHFTPLALFPHAGAARGGGLFVDNQTVEIGTPTGACAHHPDYPPVGLRVRRLPDGYSIESSRMFRDGWTIVGRHGVKRHAGRGETLHYERRPEAGGSSLYHFENPTMFAPMHGVEWADYDQRGRLVYARDGVLWTRTPAGQHRQLIDFTRMRYRPPTAPALRRG